MIYFLRAAFFDDFSSDTTCFYYNSNTHLNFLSLTCYYVPWQLTIHSLKYNLQSYIKLKLRIAH